MHPSNTAHNCRVYGKYGGKSETKPQSCFETGRSSLYDIPYSILKQA